MWNAILMAEDAEHRIAEVDQATWHMSSDTESIPQTFGPPANKFCLFLQEALQMLFNVYVEGEFNNIIGVSIDQSYPIKIKCTSCFTCREKPVVLSIDSHREGEVHEKSNLTATCGGCRRLMSFTVATPTSVKEHLLPTNYEDEFKKAWFAEMENSKFHVSTIKTNNAEVVSAGPCELSIVSDDKVLFTNVNTEGGAVAEHNNLNKISSISNLRFTVEQSK
jgi:hypothetical protein